MPRFLWLAFAGVFAGIGILALRTSEIVDLGAAYKAKVLCSSVFVSRRDPLEVLGEDLAVEDLWPLGWMPVHVDRARSVVDAGIPWLLEQRAVFRPGLGCTLIHGQRLEDGRDAPNIRAKAQAPGRFEHRVEAMLDWAFSEPDPDRPRRTRAVVLVQDGHIIGERYGAGFGPATPLAGWSMAKMALNALVGIVIGQGHAQLSDPLDPPEWEHDGRRQITLDELLHMSSGLAFSEDYGEPLQDVTRMLLLAPDAAAFAAAKPLISPPGSRWHYASGTSNILSRWLSGVVGANQYGSFPRQALFGPLGMDSAVLEQDAAGNFVASSFLYATARDWARLGQLYLQDGVWEGQRILPQGWVTYSTRPAPAAQNQEYGAHIWLRLPESYRSNHSVAIPADAFHAIGFEGQFITVIPSRRAVLVRLGLTPGTGNWPQDQFISRALAAMPR